MALAPPSSMTPAAEILIIDDEELDRQVLHELIALRGRGRARVTEAGGWQAGLALARSRTFDLVLLDSRLRDVSAVSALRILGEEAPNLLILAHTSFLTAETRQAARDRGPFDVVVRGHLDQLWFAIADLLNARGGQKRSASAA
jgi:DNA-binding NtrC family response regulator